MRRQLIDELRQKGIRDERVLGAMNTLPRHFFLDNAFEEWAYQDQPFPIAAGQTISQPYTVAYMTELLEARKRDKVLEIGTGSGYQAAILAMLGGALVFRDGYKGPPEFPPFDRIIVTAGAPYIPEPLKQQLKIGGILVIPVGEDVQTMFRITRRSETEFEEEKKGSCCGSKGD